MMRDVPLMVEMTRRIVAAVKTPVTVKTRLGWDEESKNIEEIALRLQDVGIAALTIHGRTRAQMYRGEADWTLIGKVKNNPQIRIPIIGNGDVDSGPKAREMFDRFTQKVSEESGRPVPTGVFGADMRVHLINWGPVTIWLDSREVLPHLYL